MKDNKKFYLIIGSIALAVLVVGAVALNISTDGRNLQGRLSLRGNSSSEKSSSKGSLTGEPKPQSPEPTPAGQEINRAELAKLIVAATGVPMNTAGAPHFPDVKSADWFYNYVETAYNNGWMQGYPDGTFKPGNYVNRAEGAKILVSSILPGCSASGVYPLSPYYLDVPADAWFYAYVQKMADCKMVDILPSSKSMYFPSYLLSRARAQYMIDNAKKAGWIK